MMNENRGTNFGATVGQLILGTAGTLAGNAKATKALSAINTAVTGAKEGFDRDILVDRTLQILMTQMRASRAQRKAIILGKLKSGYEEWPIGLAMSDLLAYENAGTLNSALTAVAEAAAVTRQAAENEVAEKSTTVAYDNSAASTAIQDYLAAQGKDENEAIRRTDIVRKAMKGQGIPDSIGVTQFAYSTDSRKRAVLVDTIAAEVAAPEIVAALSKGLVQKEAD